MLRSRHIGLLLFFLHSITIRAQYSFDNAIVIDRARGLPSNEVNAIAKDPDGFMWFGTADGLCRFDGLQIKEFRPEESTLFPLTRFTVQALLIEGDYIWIGHDAGLLCFNRITERFQAYPQQPEEVDTSNLRSNKVNSIVKDENGILWLGTGRMGMVRYQPSRGIPQSYSYAYSENTNSILSSDLKHVMAIHQDILFDSILWAATRGGLLRLNKLTEEVDWYYKSFPDETLEKNYNRFLLIHQEPDGKLYLGTWYEGVKIFDPATENFSDLPVAGDEYWGIYQNRAIRNIHKEGKDNFWITSLGGILKYDSKQQRFTEVFKNEPEEEGKKIGINLIDESGRIWYNYKSGVFLFDPLLQQFNYSRFRHQVGKIGAIPRMIIEEEETGNLILSAQYSEGLMHLDRASGQWSLIPPPDDFFHHADYFHSWSAAKLSAEAFLISEQKNGFYLYEPGQPGLIFFSEQPLVDIPRFFSMIKDHRGHIWIGTRYDGLIRFNLQTNEFTYFKKELDHPETEAFATLINHLFIDSKDNLWIRRTGGYSIYLEARDTFLNFLYPLNNKEPIHVENFAEDRNGRIWMAGGQEAILYYADVNQPEYGTMGKIRVFPEAEEKLNIKYVETDLLGNIWIATNIGLGRLDPDDFSIQKFGYEYGLKSLGYYLKQLRTGEMVAGHRDETSFFYPDRLHTNAELPRPYLTSFKIFDEELQTDSSLFSRPGIKLSFKQNFFAIEYSAIAYTFPGQVTYQYKLEGFEENWTDAGVRKYAAYTNVPGGSYTFQLRAINSEGMMNEIPLELAIRIIPPWWKTSWAYVCFALAFLGCLYFLYRFQVTRQLQKAETRHLRELNAVKTRFYTNITHEFRTPLTVILGMAEQMRKKPDEWLGEGIRIITRNGKRLLELVNQMLALQKLESGAMPLELIRSDIIAFLKYLLESFHSLAKAKSIRLSLHSDLGEAQMDYDPEKLQTVISNLLSNAIKFTPKNGHVSVFVETVSKPGDDLESLLIKVKDTGIGIPAEKLPHIFDRFFQVDDSSTRKGEGTGIGLALTRELVKLMGGELSVASTPGKGSEFGIVLPVSRSAETWEEPKSPVNKPDIEHFPVTAPAVAWGPSTVAGKAAPLLLIMEDNPDVVAYIRSCLEEKYQIYTAGDGMQGIHMAFDLIPDLILSDVMMPEKDGFEVCGVLKKDERTSHIPIIMLTAKADMDSRLKGLDHGADAYLVKPFHEEELKVRVAKLLEMRRSLQKHYLALAGIEEGQEIAAGPPESAEDSFLRKILDIAKDHLSDPGYSIPQFCKDIGMSHPQLHRKITALTSLSANRFLRSIRLAEAKSLLKDPSLSISEVAYDAGFNDPAYFSRVFTREFGISPTAFRES